MLAASLAAALAAGVRDVATGRPFARRVNLGPYELIPFTTP